MGIFKSLLEPFKHITLEPVFFLFCVNLGLGGISSRGMDFLKFYSSESPQLELTMKHNPLFRKCMIKGLYVSKTCLVNLKNSTEACNSLHNHTELHLETQKYVSEIQAYNGMLQSAPGIVFTLFAGPMTDRFGRKPLIICALLGYLLLDIIFLINSYWFYELKVPNIFMIR